MNKKAIESTALCCFDDVEKTYVVKSSLSDRVIGVARTELEAWKIFKEILHETYIAYLEGTLVEYQKPGRPAKGNVHLHAEIRPEVKEKIEKKAKELGISQGDVIGYLSAVEDAKTDLEKRYKKLQTKLQRFKRPVP